MGLQNHLAKDIEESLGQNRTMFSVDTNVTAPLEFDAAMREKYERLLLDSIRSELLYTYSTPLSACLIVLYTICFLNSIAVLVLIWVVSMAIMAPLLFVNHLDHVTLDFGLSENLTLTICKEDWPSDAGKQQYSVALFVFHLLIPAAIMIVANALVGKKLWRADDVDEVENNATRLEGIRISHAVVTSGLKRQRGVVKMLVALFSVFFVFWTPYYVITLWLDFRSGKHWEDNSVAGNVYPFSLFLGLANSAINPICYSLMNARFREATKDVFSRRMPWRPPSSETPGPEQAANTNDTGQDPTEVFSL
ncbi:PREDICTED: neuropeptide FF receptor 2-like [Branchiostoma belcheri]|uniref:Neuropeptide FF receptor 2-like n=1 Tax=Branchiostoma belcheri TaxID=7741 RepID=A0A6P5ACZ3_BRABE|nr:PREDICTED: neuropeptide FF receptor 2-like [Branchiostoma belcheri]